jgi:hypothetical protein
MHQYRPFKGVHPHRYRRDLPVSETQGPDAEIEFAVMVATGVTPTPRTAAARVKRPGTVTIFTLYQSFTDNFAAGGGSDDDVGRNELVWAADAGAGG